MIKEFFILCCLWIFNLYVRYALLIASVVWPMATEQQLGHHILTLMWKKKEDEASYHIFLQEVFTCGILDRKNHIHTVAQICLFSVCAPTSTTEGRARTCSSEYADPVHAGCVAVSPNPYAQAFALDR